jgi:hypothetical protein
MMKIRILLILLVFIVTPTLVSGLGDSEITNPKNIIAQKTPVITEAQKIDEQKISAGPMTFQSRIPILAITWVKVYQEGDSSEARSIRQTSDGGYIIAGRTTGPDFTADTHGLLIKIDSLGNIQWDKTYTIRYDGDLVSAEQTLSGKYIATGRRYTGLETNYDVWLIKTDENGNLVWEKTYGGMNSDYGRSVKQIPNAYGSYIIAGITQSFGVGDWDIYLIKTDADGNLQWQKDFGGSRWDTANSMLRSDDGGYMIVGETESFGSGNSDLWLLKRDPNGNRVWDKTFGGPEDDIGNSIQKTSDGGYILAGEKDGDPWLIKTDSNGNKVWDRTYEGRYATYAQQTSDGGYIIATDTVSNPYRKQDLELIKTDASGNQQWYVTIGGPENEHSYSVQQTSDSGYIIAGTTESCEGGTAILVVKTDAEGRVYNDPDCASITVRGPSS